MNILTLSCWSHSIKYHLFSWGGRSLLAAGLVKRVGLGGASISLKVTGREQDTRDAGFVDHHDAVQLILKTLAVHRHGVSDEAGRIAAVGHRVAHGGETFHHSMVIDGQVLDTIRELRELAPLHIDANIAGIEAGVGILPDVPQVAIFDTTFHVTMPDFAGTPEAGWVTAAWAHGQGFAAEAVGAMLDWADQRPEFDRSVAMIALDNAPSLRLARKAGYTRFADTTYKAHPITLFERHRPV